MSIKTQRSGCGRQHSFRDERSVRKFNCKSCGQVNQVPQLEGPESDEDFGGSLDDAVNREAQSP